MKKLLHIDIPNTASVVTKATGIIFRNTHCRTLEFDKWGVDKAQHFFEFLDITDSEVYTDLSKEQVIAKFNELI